MCELSKIRINIDNVWVNATLEEYENNTDLIQCRTVNGIHNIRGKDSYYKFLISYNDTDLINMLKHTNYIEIEGNTLGIIEKYSLKNLKVEKLSENKLIIYAKNKIKL